MDKILLKTIITRLFIAAILPFALASSPICAAERSGDNGLVLIAKTIPTDIKTTNAPDQDAAHYRVLDNTHFSYRCYVAYMLKTNQAAVEVCEIDPVKLEIFNWPENEVIHLTSGQVTVTDAAARPRPTPKAIFSSCHGDSKGCGSNRESSRRSWYVIHCFGKIDDTTAGLRPTRIPIHIPSWKTAYLSKT